jgi:DNA polymerase zeta
MDFHDSDILSSVSLSCTSAANRSTQPARLQSNASVKSCNLNKYEYGCPPPTLSDLRESLEFYGLPQKIYRDPYYSNSSDVPRRVRTYAGIQFRLKGGQGIAHLEEWNCIPGSGAGTNQLVSSSVGLQLSGSGGWEYASCPPSVRQTKKWLRSNRKSSLPPVRRPRSQVNRYSCMHRPPFDNWVR